MSPVQAEGPSPPSRVGNYRIEERLGAGGMGVVYRAYDEVLRRPLALKHLLPGRADHVDHVDDTMRRRFRREAQAAARLNHPSIVHIYDIVETAEGDWIVMELVEGHPLDWLISAGEIDLLQALRLGHEIAEGLGEAHAHGIVHRDLKSNNVMVTKSGRAKILDFGIAKLPSELGETELSQAGMIIGTYHAMSPEQAMGMPVDHRSDLFSLGSLLYEMLAGTSPFRTTHLTETLARICSYQQPPVSRVRREVPPEVSDLIDGLLKKRPDQRPGRAADVAAILEAAADRVRTGRAAPLPIPAPSAPSPWTSNSVVATYVEGMSPAQRSRSEAVPAPESEALSASRRLIRERRQVTLACCDLTGVRVIQGRSSTAAIDPEVLSEVFPEIKALTHRVAELFGGEVGETLGHRVALHFGYPQAHEDSAQRAVRAGLQLVAEVERLSSHYLSGGELRLALRVGIHTGTAIVLPEPATLTLGSTLDTAASILGRAAPGEVLVSTATQRLLKDAFATKALPPVEVQGTGESLPVFRVLEASASTDQRERPAPLIGREEEIGLLLDLWRRAAEGTGQVILISGDAGIGKSHLVHAMRERVGRSGEETEARWLLCQGSPYARNSPLQPVIEMLYRLLQTGTGGTTGTSGTGAHATPIGRLEELLRSCRLPLDEAVPLFASLLGLSLEERYPPSPLPPDRQRGRTLELLASLALNMAEIQPLVWVIEDLHWLDPSTLQLLDLLLDQAVEAPLCLVLTVRLQAMDSLWGPRPHLTQLNLVPLGASEVERLIDVVPGSQALPESIRRQIVARTDGVPLFVEELTKSVLESGSTRESSEIPTTLRDSLAARLDRLGTGKEVAQLASVLGRSFSFELLAAVSPFDETTLQRELRALVRAELLQRRGSGARLQYLFHHALIRDAAYDSLLKRERQQIHRRIADALESRFADLAESQPELLAHHLTEAGAAEPAIDAWFRAARQAMARSANQEAVQQLDRALELVPGLPPNQARDERELQLQISRIPALIATRGFVAPEVEQAYARGIELCERQDAPRFDLLWGLFTFYCVQARNEPALTRGHQLLELAEARQSAPDLFRSHYGLGATFDVTGDFHEALRHFRAGLSVDAPDLGEILRTSFGFDDRKVVTAYQGRSLWMLGLAGQARDRARDALAWAREDPHPFTLTTVLLIAGFVHHFRRDGAAVREHAEEMLALAEKYGLFQVRDANVLLGLSRVAGDSPSDEAIDHLRRSIEAYRASGFRVFVSFYLAELAAACLRRGRLAECGVLLKEAQELAEGGPERFWEPEIHRLRGELLSVAELPDQAEAEIRRALEIAAGLPAPALELRAAISLARLFPVGGEAREILSAVYARLSEGLDTPDALDARALLSATSA